MAEDARRGNTEERGPLEATANCAVTSVLRRSVRAGCLPARASEARVEIGTVDIRAHEQRYDDHWMTEILAQKLRPGRCTP
jgi:hypothetical protein